MLIWAIVLVALVAFGLFMLFCGLGSYYFEKSVKVRSKKQFTPKSPVIFDEYRTPQDVLDQLKMCRELMPMHIRVKAVKQPPIPIDKQTREEIKKYIEENNAMAMHERKMELAERDGVFGVIISRDEYREYVELQKKRDRSECSLRAQMQAQNQNALNLARKTVRLIDTAGLKNLSILASDLANDVYDLAQAILAEE